MSLTQWCVSLLSYDGRETFFKYTGFMLDVFRELLSEKGSLDLVIRIRPQAARTQLQSVLEDQSLKIDIAAPAEDNRGNLALVRFLAEQFEIPQSNIKILSGKTSRMKLVRITAAH